MDNYSPPPLMNSVRFEMLRSRLRGDLLEPENPGYEQARKIWNATVNKRPLAIARCSCTADIVAAIQFAREHDLLTAIRGGGHNVGGRALCDDGLVLDLSRMRGVTVGPSVRMVRVQGVPHSATSMRKPTFSGWRCHAGSFRRLE